VTGLRTDGQTVQGLHVIQLDGTVNLGVYGRVNVNGSTLKQVEEKLTDYLGPFADDPKAMRVDVVLNACNSQFCYIEKRDGDKSFVFRLPISDAYRVCDALITINRFQTFDETNRIVLRRRATAAERGRTMEIDWHGIWKYGETRTNYQLMPGDRLVIDSSRSK